jgi:predicted HicB family RNase H-like nuclease
MARKKPSKLGRPPKHEGERLSKNRTFRVRGTLDKQLEAAAKDAGHSVSEEIERRLEESFRREEIERDTATLQVRLSKRLRRELEEAAKHKGHSMNTEIWDRLDVSFQREVQEEMIRRVAQEAVAEAAKLRVLPSDEELSHPSADKEEKSK